MLCHQYKTPETNVVCELYSTKYKILYEIGQEET